MPKLYAPDSYHLASPEERAKYTNGCGPEGWKLDVGVFLRFLMWLVRLDWKPACLVHDWMYAEGSTIEDKDEADRAFLNNMLRIVDDKGGPRWLRRRRRALAVTFYAAVAELGGPAFWDGDKRSVIKVTGSP